MNEEQKYVIRNSNYPYTKVDNFNLITWVYMHDDVYSMITSHYVTGRERVNHNTLYY